MANIAKTVTGIARKNLSGQTHGAQLFCIERVTAGLQVVFYERVIEVDVMRNEDGAFQKFKHFFSNGFKCRRVLYHIVIDAGKRLNIPRNGLKWVDEGFKNFHYPFAIE